MLIYSYINTPGDWFSSPIFKPSIFYVRYDEHCPYHAPVIVKPPDGGWATLWEFAIFHHNINQRKSNITLACEVEYVNTLMSNSLSIEACQTPKARQIEFQLCPAP